MGADGHVNILFYGNCQVLALRAIYERFVQPFSGTETKFIDAYQKLDDETYDNMRKADILIAQVSSQPPEIGYQEITQSADVHLVPIVSGAFLWPNQGQPHPRPPPFRYGNYHYMPEYNDRFLGKLIEEGVSPEEALRTYRNIDVAAICAVGRRYELELEAQRWRDKATGFDCAAIIEEHFRTEEVFQSAYYFNIRIANHLTAGLFRSMKIDPQYTERVARYMRYTPFAPRCVPIHPSVVRHFGITYVDEATRYQFLSEGAFTFNEYVLRFMRSEWNLDLEEGIADTHRGDAGAAEKLRKGLAQSAFSAIGWHLLSILLEREGDDAGAIGASRRAAALAPRVPSVPLRLGRLLMRAGDVAGAEWAFREAVWVAGENWRTHAGLRDCLLHQGRLVEAIVEAREAVALSPDKQAAHAELDRLQQRYA